MIFIDTGPFLARFLKKDQYHNQALRLWTKLEKSKKQCLTSSAVLHETLTLMGRRSSYEFAAERARSIYQSQVLTILYAGPDDEHVALESFEKFSDQKVIFVDCLSFALMKKHKLHEVFTFDQHFSMAGFKIWS